MTTSDTSTATPVTGPPGLTVTDLRTDGLVDPVGRGLDRPRLAWSIGSSERATRQTAYRIETTLPGGDVVWDSGRVASAQSVDVPYGGEALRGRTQYSWRVRIWDSRGQASGWSDVATWETALAGDEWQATWIRHEEPDETTQPPFPFERPAAYFRRQLTLDAPVARARAYVTALGLYELRVNGVRAGSDVLTPGWTDYARRVQYQTVDVTALLRPGDNAVGVVVADGWYAGRIAWVGRGVYGLRPALLLQLEIELEGGERVVASTDELWSASTGEIRGADLLDGEAHDSTRALRGWDRPSYDDSAWARGRRHGLVGAELVAEVGRGSAVVEELAPVQVVDHADGRTLVDFGQNAAGWVRLAAHGQRGRRVTVRHGEVLEADGSLHTANLRTAAQTDTYVVEADDEVLVPTFTYHGFRFAEISGHDGPIRTDDLRFQVVTSAARRTGSFECSDPLLNDIQRCIVWGQRSNFVSVPTDCPQRDERLGWTGDAQVFAPTAAFNFDVCEFFRKWLVDLEDAQHPSGAYPDVAPMVTGLDYGNAGWADAGIMIPWALYLRYGDERLLTDGYDSMCRYARYLMAESAQGFRSAGRYGDWVSLGVHTSKDVIGTAFAAHSLDLMRRIAETLAREGDVIEFGTAFESLRTSFVERFVDDDGRVASETQTAYLLALHMDLVPHALRPSLARRLADDVRARGEQLTTGFLGTPLALPVLSENGEHELACRLAQKDSFPSWGFQVRNGATTMWERWDGWTPETGFYDSPMNSFNHYAFGSVGDWLYSMLGGLAPSPDGPGYRHSLIRPRPGGTVTWARTSLDSRHGRIAVSWRRTGDRFTLDLELPVNTSADVELPAAKDGAVLEGDVPADRAQGVHDVRRDDVVTRLRVGSGRYSFTSTCPARLA